MALPRGPSRTSGLLRPQVHSNDTVRHRERWSRRPLPTLGRVRYVQCSRLERCGCEALCLAYEGASESLRGSGSLKAFFVEGGPVGNASVKEPDIDVVEVVWRVNPFTTAIVDLETEIWGLTWLPNRGEIASCVKIISAGY